MTTTKDKTAFHIIDIYEIRVNLKLIFHIIDIITHYFNKKKKKKIKILSP